MIPTARPAIPTAAASRFTGAEAKAVAAASGAGATASSSDDQVAGMGSAPTSAEMVISCAAPARNSAARHHGQLGGAGESSAWAAEGASDELPAGAPPIVIGTPSPRVRRSRTSPTRLPGAPNTSLDRAAEGVQGRAAHTASPCRWGQRAAAAAARRGPLRTIRAGQGTNQAREADHQHTGGGGWRRRLVRWARTWWKLAADWAGVRTASACWEAGDDPS